MPVPSKPTKAELAAATGKKVPDLIAPGLQVLFCGTNPGLYSAAVGHHFARPGNRFWPALHAGRFTDHLLSPFDDHQLLEYGGGLTNVVDRATARADELSADEFTNGARRLERKLRRYRPACVAFMGIGAYRTAFRCKDATVGRQPKMIAESFVWVLPNPSGLNAHYQIDDIARLLVELRKSVNLPVDNQK